MNRSSAEQTGPRPAHVEIALLALGLALWVGLLGFDVWNPQRTLIFRDTPLMGLPNLQFLGESLRAGTIPFLHPRRGTGTPFLADPQTSSLYPPAWGFALVSTFSSGETAFRLHQFFHLWWLALGWGLLGRAIGGTLLAGFFAGVTGAAAAPHLHAIEWMQILAGMSWVPWGLLAARAGAARRFAVCLTLGFVSGHAYLWVALPVLALAGLTLAPRACFRRMVLSVLLLPLLTAPAWIGYLTLSAEVKPHGLQSEATAPVTAFEPKHLGTFFFPKLFRNFQFGYADGRIVSFKPWGSFGWARLCYIGILPLLAVLVVVLRRARKESPEPDQAPVLVGSAVLIGAGLLMAMGIPMLSGILPGIFRHMHHPASFIHLADWGLILLLPLGLRFLLDEAPEPPAWFLGLAMGGGALSLVHQHYADLALVGLVHPLWNFSWRAGWYSWAFLIGVALVLAFHRRSRQGGRKMLAAALAMALLALHLCDLHLNNTQRLPLTGTRPVAESLLDRFARDGKGPGNRIWMTPDLARRILETSDKAVMSEDYVSWFSNSGFPNQPARKGWYQFGDYNPPFLISSLFDWHSRLMDSRSPAELSASLRLSGVGWLLATDEFPPGPDWKALATAPIPEATVTLRLWRLPDGNPASLLTRAELDRLDRRVFPFASSPISIPVVWEGSTARIAIPAEAGRPTGATSPSANIPTGLATGPTTDAAASFPSDSGTAPSSNLSTDSSTNTSSLPRWTSAEQGDQMPVGRIPPSASFPAVTLETIGPGTGSASQTSMGKGLATHPGQGPTEERLLFLPVAPLRGWSATVDGQPATIIERSGFGLAVSLPPGERQVICRYRQPLSAHALLMLLLGCIVLGWNVRRRGDP